jgi:hypothetical protein
VGVRVGVEEVQALVSALQGATADLAERNWDELPSDAADAVIGGVESVARTLSTVSYEAINRRNTDSMPGKARRLRDQIANLLHISALEAGARIATAADVAGEQPDLPETAAALRYGLIGAEHVRIIGDTIAKLPDTANQSDRARFDLELAAVAVAERPEVLRSARSPAHA